MPFSQAQFSYALFNTTCSLLTSKKAWQHMVLIKQTVELCHASFMTHCKLTIVRIVKQYINITFLFAEYSSRVLTSSITFIIDCLAQYRTISIYVCDL